MVDKGRSTSTDRGTYLYVQPTTHTHAPTTTPTDKNAQVTGKEAGEITYSSRDTSSGKYRSLTIQCPVQNADQLYAIYDRISQDARVKFKF